MNWLQIDERNAHWSPTHSTNALPRYSQCPFIFKWIPINFWWPPMESFHYQRSSITARSQWYAILLLYWEIVLKNRLDRGSMSLIVRRIHASALDEFWFELSRVRWAFIWKYDFELQNGESISNNSWTCHSKLASVSSMPPGKFNFPKNPYGLQASILEDFFGFNYKR